LCIREAGWNGPARGLRYDDKYNKNYDIIVKRRRRMMIRMIIIMIMIKIMIMILKMIKRIIMILIELWDN